MVYGTLKDNQTTIMGCYYLTKSWYFPEMSNRKENDLSNSFTRNAASKCPIGHKLLDQKYCADTWIIWVVALKAVANNTNKVAVSKSWN